MSIFSFSRWLCLFLAVLMPFFAEAARRPQGKPKSQANRLVSINIIDRNGFSETITNVDRLKKYENVDFLKNTPYEKVLRIYGRDENGDVPSFITSYYPNGQPKQYLEVVNGRALGKYQEWHSNGQMKLDTRVIGGSADIHPGAESSWMFEGINRAWDEEGHLLAEFNYQKGELEGISNYYHTNGKIWKKVPYHKDMVQGKVEVFLESGQLLQTLEYAADEKHGTSIRYWISKQKAAEECYRTGKLQSAQYFDQAGKKIAEIASGRGIRATFSKDGIAELQEYRNGVLEGEVKVFGKNNKLLKTYRVKNGLKHGDEITYFENMPLKPKLLITWFENKIQGPVKSWYPNGILESQKEMSGNTKSGLATAWYSDGSLMLIEEYERNKLLKGEYFKKKDRTPISRVEAGKGIATLYDADGNFDRKVNYLNGKPVMDDK